MAGIDYPSIPVVAGLMGIAMTAATFDDLRVLETAALDAMRSRARHGR